MILLDPKNCVIEETLNQRFNAVKQGSKPEAVCAKIVDYDGVIYSISNREGDKNKILLSISMKFYKDLQQHGLDEFLKKIYANYLQAEAEANYNITLEFDLQNLPDNTSELASRAAYLRRNCFASVFEKYFDLLKDAESGHQRAVINFRDDESLFVEARGDRVTVIFSTLFTDSTDAVIGKIFLQEFRDCRKGNAPGVIYSYGEPPLELKDSGARVGNNVGYITFILNPRHTTGDARANTIDLIYTFRTYLHYHIKCSKAYMHSRMRNKTSEFLKILNRAKPEVKNVARKTAKGTTFVQS